VLERSNSAKKASFGVKERSNSKKEASFVKKEGSNSVKEASYGTLDRSNGAKEVSKSGTSFVLYGISAGWELGRHVRCVLD
jgi:hypothetical protein